MMESIVEVTEDNIADVFPQVISAIEQSSFLAIDTEFTGMGDRLSRRSCSDQNIEDRYLGLVNVARKQALLELGLSVFSYSEKQENQKCVTMEVKTFTFLLLRQDIFEVTPESLTFLAQNGMDFNKLFSKGIRFTPPSVERYNNGMSNTSSNSSFNYSDNQKEFTLSPQDMMRKIFQQLVNATPEIVLHNGILDLLFVFFSFRGDLPLTLPAFVFQVTNLFPHIYDTKYIAEFQTEETATFLEYLLNKCERKNEKQKLSGDWHIESISPGILTSARELPQTTKGTSICLHYARHGYCRNGITCDESHDINKILDHEEEKENKKKRKRTVPSSNNNLPNETPTTKLQSKEELASTTRISDTLNTANNESELAQTVLSVDNKSSGDNSGAKRSGRRIHGAGNDAFMTGFIFAFFCNAFDEKAIQYFENTMYLVRKDFPLLLQKTPFNQPSGSNIKNKKEPENL
eukprot:TRINITY_DN4641_c0_g2_i1.p1 TRINITY_DN4641_c0_g2~~TRINITY_DN4641_c0_g2_i1.p1  ORF type:complete len:461 (-),score=78.99 TRINITY_DN4641_c0_g2_i1:42-1424(-)